MQLMQRIRVPAGFILVPIMLLLAHPSALSLLWGGILGLIGLGIRLHSQEQNLHVVVGAISKEFRIF